MIVSPTLFLQVYCWGLSSSQNVECSCGSAGRVTRAQGGVVTWGRPGRRSPSHKACRSLYYIAECLWYFNRPKPPPHCVTLKSFWSCQPKHWFEATTSTKAAHFRKQYFLLYLWLLIGSSCFLQKFTINIYKIPWDLFLYNIVC